MSNERTRTPKRKTVRRINYVRIIILLGIFITLIGIGSATGLVLYSVKDMPAWNPKALEPNLPSYIFDKNEKFITKIYVENRVPVKFDEIPDTVKSAFLSIEDIRFYDHKGLDLRRILGALLADIKAGKADQGASTITQQLVKRAFLSPEKTIKRKIQEATLAIELERRFTKDEIFEMYLNQIYFGEGAYGIQSAAQVYFNKDVKDLKVEEAALLAGIPKAPTTTYNPFKKLDNATNRRNVVLSSMAKYGFITEAQADFAKSRDVVLNSSKVKIHENYDFPYFVDYVTDILVDKYGENKVYKGGLNVYTTLDPHIQKTAEEALANPKNFPKSDNDENGITQPQGAIVVLDPSSGHVKAIVGGRDHKQKRQFNRATDAVRQPGSAFKPIVAYGPAIEKGKSPADVIDDSPTKFGNHEFKNYDGQFHGIVTYRKAIQHSYNIPAVKILKENGVTKSVSFAKKLGISTFVEEKDDNLAIALGGLTRGVKPIELAAAYGTFANQGVYVQPIVITQVKDRDGNILDQFKPKKSIAMKKTTAFILTSMMESAVKYGTGTAASLGNRPVAGKTGTTSDYKDAWFAGYTPELACVVWIGNDEPKRMSKVTGGSYPARIWREVMSKSLKDIPVKDFEKPDGLVSATICSKSGNIPSDSCPDDDLVTDIFVKGSVPSEVCDIHGLVEVCADSNQLPTENCPTKVTKSFLKGSAPTEKCTIHIDNNVSKGIPVCTDPSHGGLLYLANIPKSNEEGGCPQDFIEYQQFPEGLAPNAPCTIPEHQIRPKPPDSPDVTLTQPADKPKTEKPKQQSIINRGKPN